MRQYSLNDAKPSRVQASLSNKYSFEEVNNNKVKNNSNITIYKYNSEQLE